jgi:hypothetical protein
MTLVNDRLASALADRYRIERELGAGGMATVYLAHDLKHERDVAIKVLREDLSASLDAGPLPPRGEDRRATTTSAHPAAARLGRSRRVPVFRDALRQRTVAARAAGARRGAAFYLARDVRHARRVVTQRHRTATTYRSATTRTTPAEPRDRGESASRREVAGSLNLQPSGYGVIINVTLIFCGLFDATGEVTGIVAVYVPTASMVFVGCMMRLYGAVDVRPLF